MKATRRILVIQGHPDPAGAHFCHALAASYAQGAQEAGHDVQKLEVAGLDFPLLRTQYDWETGTVPESLRGAQEAIRRAEHIAIFFPLWLGDMPAVLKAFWEQVLRPGFAFTAGPGGNPFKHKGLTGRTARLVVTMGMPSAIYRLYFMAHSVRSLERNILGFVGIAPVEETLVGSVQSLDDGQAQRWLAKLHALGRKAA
ncbi:NAD(P)H-dependent oxidoreductase [Caenimonas sp. DR4.4]|uniref:NAD(P)H-dependent oxidoreductase n=2 Tax=Caenimonas aquaedulcis TaxID=2793270 RepID=A0A931H8C0_9BURK|nr:NAD(P)H-dependent oxidoreductase [Caenimonas aquaedulcis]